MSVKQFGRLAVLVFPQLVLVLTGCQKTAAPIDPLRDEQRCGFQVQHWLKVASEPLVIDEDFGAQKIEASGTVKDGMCQEISHAFGGPNASGFRQSVNALILRAGDKSALRVRFDNGPLAGYVDQELPLETLECSHELDFKNLPVRNACIFTVHEARLKTGLGFEIKLTFAGRFVSQASGGYTLILEGFSWQ